MRQILVIFILFCCCPPSWATWTLVHNSANTACVTSSTTCNITTTATGTGNVIIIVMNIGDTTSTIQSVSGGGTYSLCAASACHASDATVTKSLDIAYTLASTSGTTTITVTRNGGTIGWGCRALEYSFTNGPVVLDVVGVRDQSTNSASPAGVALTLSGTNDVIVQALFGSTPTAISGSYTNPATFQSNTGYGGWINTSDGTAPTWTQTAAHAVLTAIAIKETSNTQSQITGPSQLGGASQVQ
jgi:hypothetical protein